MKCEQKYKFIKLNNALGQCAYKLTPSSLLCIVRCGKALLLILTVVVDFPDAQVLEGEPVTEG